MTKHIFNFGKTYEEIEVNGETFKLDISDESLRLMQKRFRSFSLKYAEVGEEILALNDQVVSEEKEQEIWDTVKSMMTDTIDSTLGKGSFEKVYELSGGSFLQVGEFMKYVMGIIEEKAVVEKTAKRNTYTGK